MNIGITGATGMLGSEVARVLLSHGHRVTGFGRDLKKGQALSDSGIPFTPLDLTVSEDVQRTFSGFDAVVHCAALSSPWAPRPEFERHNILATRNLIHACKTNSIPRVIHISTPSIFAEFRDRFQLSEDAEPAKRFLNPYARSKWMCEQDLEEAASPEFQVTVLRPQAILGPGEQAIFPRFFRVNREGGIPVIRGGNALTDLVPVENVADLIAQSLTLTPRSSFRVYHVSNGEPRRLLDMVTYVLTELKMPLRLRKIPFAPLPWITGGLELYHRLRPSLGEPALTRYSLSILAFSRTLDVSRAQSELGFTPRIPVDDCLDNMVRWWRNTK